MPTYSLTKIVPHFDRSGLFSVVRRGARWKVTDKEGQALGEIQFSAEAPRCVIWCDERLVGQGSYDGTRGWFVYPIHKGKIAQEALTKLDPLQYLLEKCRPNSRRKGAVAAKGL